MEWKILAGVRFFLAWIVFCLHLKWFLPHDLLVFFSKLDALSAVLGFLVISGYSIASSISKKPEQFFYRRVLRIYPLYVVAVLVSLIPFRLSAIASLGIKNTLDPFFIEPSLTQSIGNLFFTQGFLVDTMRSNPVLWTLSVEVACYLLAPVFIKLSQRVLVALMLLSCLAYIAYPYLKLQDLFFLKDGLPFLFLFWAWMLGFLYYLNRSKFFAQVGMISLGTIVVALDHLEVRGILAIGTFTGVCALVVLAPYLTLNKQFLGVLDYLGNLSYPFYLIHVPCLIICYLIFNIRNSILMAGAAIAASMVLYHAIDVPIRLRQHRPKQT
jgi:peptidoglycan/LPS O-acetylase OafA/YrhL